ncbi:MAG: transcriptional regulator [Hyphomicrobiaceae bacterium]
MTIRQLAQLTGLDKATIVRFEMGHTVRRETVSRIRAALETAGARFLDGHGEDRAGVDVPLHSRLPESDAEQSQQ